GVLLDRSTGQIAGTPTASGRFKVTFNAIDARGGRATRVLDMLVAEESTPPPTTPPVIDLGLLENPSGYGDLSELQSIAAPMQQGEWRQVNLNKFSDAWAPVQLRPMFGLGNPNPSA